MLKKRSIITTTIVIYAGLGFFAAAPNPRKEIVGQLWFNYEALRDHLIFFFEKHTRAPLLGV